MRIFRILMLFLSVILIHSVMDCIVIQQVWSVDTGFGLTVRLAGSAELLDEAKRLRRGDCVRLTGTLVAESKNYFCVGEVETLERISEKDLYPLKKK